MHGRLSRFFVWSLLIGCTCTSGGCWLTQPLIKPAQAPQHVAKANNRPTLERMPDPAAADKVPVAEKQTKAAPAAAGRKETGAGDVVALIGSRPVRLSELQPLLVETAGGEVLTEIVLDEQIARELAKVNLTVSDQDVRRERELLLAGFSADPDEARRLLDEVLRRRGMGPRRLEMSLRQTAGLRKLIAGEAIVSDEMVRRIYEQRNVPHVQCRLILVPTLREASEVLAQLRDGASFTELAVSRSIDESRLNGGLLPPIAPYDSSFPAAVTAAVARMEPGAISDPIALEQGFAILRCERKVTPETGPFEDVAERLRDELKLNLQSAAMQRKRRVLLEEAEVTVLDADLSREFRERRTRLTQP